MPLFMFATVKERPAWELDRVESAVAVLAPRALVVRSCSRESFTRRSDGRRWCWGCEGRRLGCCARRA